MRLRLFLIIGSLRGLAGYLRPATKYTSATITPVSEAALRLHYFQIQQANSYGISGSHFTRSQINSLEAIRIPPTVTPGGVRKVKRLP
jgi:hypothetical protein